MYNTSARLIAAGIFMICISWQVNSQVLFPGLTGNELLNAVQNEYTPVISFSYAEARDTLYARIDVKNNIVSGIYTDFEVFLTPMTDPTVTLFAGGLNTEHIYPQGKGATDGSPAHRNMHHLAAARVNVNGDRASLPFSDIPDAVTDKWYLEDQVRTNIPAVNRDAYSEGTGLFFEPRESVKGNVARAVFYVHAIYRDQVQAVDPDFFELQREDLCEWHFADPVDVDELDRTNKIAVYQSGKENPFVLDCTLAERMYCAGIGECMVANQDTENSKNNTLQVFQDPASNFHFLKNNDSKSIQFSYQIYSIEGQLVSRKNNNILGAGELMEINSIEQSGVKILHVQLDEGSKFQSLLLFL